MSAKCNPIWSVSCDEQDEAVDDLSFDESFSGIEVETSSLALVDGESLVDILADIPFDLPVEGLESIPVERHQKEHSDVDADMILTMPSHEDNWNIPSGNQTDSDNELVDFIQEWLNE